MDQGRLANASSMPWCRTRLLSFLRSWDRPLHDVSLEQAVTTTFVWFALMEKDMKEDREAMVLQYGHEVGHAVEYPSGLLMAMARRLCSGCLLWRQRD